MKDKNYLSNKNNWNKNYNLQIKKSIKIDPKSIFSLELKFILSKFKINLNQKSFIEIGCAPGRYLIFFNKEFNCDVSGIEYTNEGINMTKDNLKIENIPINLINEDIMKLKTDRKWEIVFSAGLIEHFKEPKKIINKISENNSKYIITIIPNYRYLNLLFLKLFRKDLIKIHNLEIMEPKKMIEIHNKKYNLIYSNYFGIINFGLYSFKNKFLRKIMYLFQIIIKKIYNLIPIRINSKYFSPYVIYLGELKNEKNNSSN